MVTWADVPYRVGPYGEKLTGERIGAETGEWEGTPYHQLIVSEHTEDTVPVLELHCPFGDDDHHDVHYCTMSGLYPTYRYSVRGATLLMGWRAIGDCYLRYEAEQCGVDELIDSSGIESLTFPDWALTPGVHDVVLRSYGWGEDYVTWLEPAIQPEVWSGTW